MRASKKKFIFISLYFILFLLVYLFYCTNNSIAMKILKLKFALILFNLILRHKNSRMSLNLTTTFKLAFLNQLGVKFRIHVFRDKN